MTGRRVHQPVRPDKAAQGRRVSGGRGIEVIHSNEIVTRVTSENWAYVYRCVDRSWLTGIIATRVAPRVEQWMPAAFSANAITWLSSSCMWVLLAGLLVLPPAGRVWLAPVWIALLWGYCILDHVDGCRARRRGTSSALGEFLDHSLDAWHASIAVIGVGLMSDGAVPWSVVAVTIACTCTATIAIWLEQWYRGEFILPVVGPVEAVLAVGLYFAATAIPATAHVLRATAWRSSALTWAAALVFAGGIAGLTTALAGVQRCRPARTRLAAWVALATFLLFLGSTAQVGWLIAGIAVTAVAADFSARVILSHLSGTAAPWPDLLGAALLAGSAVAPPPVANGARIAATAWIVMRVMLTSRAAFALGTR